MVSFDGVDLYVMVDHHVDMPIMRNYGETYTGDASVLNGVMYNAQYGWMVEGFWSPPTNALLWIEQSDVSPAIRSYSGGTMMNQGTFSPIFSTDGSAPRIQWSGSMLHNWYATAVTGDFNATYMVYFGDEMGVPIPGYGHAEVTIDWVAVAPPGTFELFSPADVSLGIPLTPELAWSPSADAVLYAVTISQSPSLEPALWADVTEQTTLHLPPGILDHCTEYYWGVRAINDEGETSSIPVASVFETWRPADFDRSGFVDFEDYIAFVTAFELGGDDADFDQSGFVDIEDFFAFVHAFEDGC
ncbi:MAG: EF-hand domain-containing protein [Phycisphaerae bacterium]|nr:EF-hand domain-containing protein [Phycisphaerae bacterium]